MGFDDLVDYSCFISSAIGQMGHSASAASHAIGELSKAVGAYSHAEGYGSLPCRQPTEKRVVTIVKMSIVRKSSLSERQTTTLTIDSEEINWDVLEKNFGLLNRGDVVFYK